MDAAPTSSNETRHSAPQRPAMRPHAQTTLLILAILAADQISKLSTSRSGCGPVICPVRNDALMMGLGAGSQAHVVSFGLIGLAAFALWARRVARRVDVSWVAIAAVVAGVAGNLVDRAVLGSVRDFLVIPGVAVINAADVAIAVGLTLICVPLYRTILTPTGGNG